MLDYDHGPSSRSIPFDFGRDARKHVLECDRTFLFRKNRNIVGIPLSKQSFLFSHFSVLVVEKGAGRNRIIIYDSVIGVQNLNRSRLVERNLLSFSKSNQTKSLELEFAGFPNVDHGIFASGTGNATDMEGTHGQLRARFPNRLSGNNSNRGTLL